MRKRAAHRSRDDAVRDGATAALHVNGALRWGSARAPEDALVEGDGVLGVRDDGGDVGGGGRGALGLHDGVGGGTGAAARKKKRMARTHGVKSVG